MTGGAKNSARRRRSCSIELIRAGFEPFRVRGIPNLLFVPNGVATFDRHGTSRARLKTGAGQR
jgi:hypothetical protein